MSQAVKNINPFNFPENTDVLFNETNADYRHNAMIRNGVSHFFLYSDAYKEGALNLFNELDGSAFKANTLVYPLIFLCRHFLELRLKELISGLNYSTKEEYSFPKGHKLINLWNEYCLLIIKAGDGYGPEQHHIENVEKLIKEFDSIDPGSMSFRYPVNLDKKPNLLITTIDLENFRLVMDKLFIFFDMQSDSVFHLVSLAEEFFTNIRIQYMQEMEG